MARVRENPIYPISESRKVLDAWREFTATAPDAASTAFAVWGIPDHPDMPQELIGTPVCLIDGMYADAPEAGEALFEPLRAISRPIMDMSGRPTYLEVQTGFDEFMRDGDLYYWKSLFLDTLSDEVVNTMLSWIDHRPNPRILVIIRHMGGAVGRVGEADWVELCSKARVLKQPLAA